MAEKKKTTGGSKKKANVSSKKQPISDDGSLPQAGNKQSGYALNDDLVEQALISGEYRDLLEIYFGEDLYDELRRLAGRARTARTRGGPRVLVLPGIMGSKLGKEGAIFDDTIWLDPIDVIAGRLPSLSLTHGEEGIKALGVLLTVYLKIKLRLKLAGFDTDFHPFDWRQNIAEEGARLAERIHIETSSRHSEVYLVAHSMGGLIARSAVGHLEASGEDDKVRRLIMLGTPNYGSFSPVQAFSGYHSMVKKVAALDLKHSEEELVNEVFNTFVGLYQMLPAPQKFTGLDMYNPANWPSTGIAPRPEILSSAADIHKHLAPGRDRFTLIAGINQNTIVDVHREAEQFVFIESKEGDGTVPLLFAELEDTTTYYVEEQHGSLPNNGDVIGAVIDLLETGSTENLPTGWTPQRLGQRREVRGAELVKIPFDERTGKNISPRELRHLLEEFAAPSKPARDELQPPLTVRPEGISSEPIVVGRKRQQRLDLRIAHGDITQVDTRAVVLGLFKGVIPSGAAAAIDRQLDGVITDFTERRILSANIGEVFIMPTNRYRMGADIVVFAGLGTYDDFNEEVLRLVAENIARTLLRTKVDDFATVLLSSGSGMATADVLSNLVDGFLRGLQDGGPDGHLRAITLCENNKARFDQMHQELLRLTTTSIFDNIETTLDIQELPPVYPPAITPSRLKPTGLDPVYLIVREILAPLPEPTDPSIEAPFTLRASVLTAGAKSTVVTDTIDIDARALNLHLETIETRDFDIERLNDFGTILGKMTLPDLVRKALTAMRDRQLVVIHDARCSRIPWETVKIDDWFPAAQAGLSRKYEADDLTVAKWLEERRLADELSILLIVNPTKDLAGAEEEGKRIRYILTQDPSIRLTELWREEATFSAVRAAFRSGKYDIVHYAGHAFFDPVNRVRSGILCHGGQVLSGVDLANLEMLPAVVFFNACEAGRVRSVKARNVGKGTAKRLETNVGLAEALLRAGVGNYIGTYWPVGDDPAQAFGEAFYRSIARGDTVGQALNTARTNVRELKSVDWADYIHYGSPSFLVKRRKSSELQ